MSRRGRRGQSRTSAPKAPPERYVKHTFRSEDASMNQPPAEPSRVADLGVGTLTMDQVIQIVTAATLSNTRVFRRPEGHDRTCSKIRG